MLFGSDKPKEKTTLILDVESGSVGSALARHSSHEPPRLFGEWRIHLPVPHTRHSSALADTVESAVAQAVAHASEVAARLRSHPKTAPMGNINKVSLFLSAPWGVPNLESGKPSFLDSLVRRIKGYLHAHIGQAPITLNTHAGALVQGMRTIFEAKGPILLCSIHGETAELTLLKNGVVEGHATMPLGVHALLRTLNTHAGVSHHEARSLLKLAYHARYAEPLGATANYFRNMFREVGEPLFGGIPVTQVYVFARGPESEFFARALSHDSLSYLFPTGGVVQPLKIQHFAPHIAAHAPNPDMGLVLNSLFIDASK